MQRYISIAIVFIRFFIILELENIKQDEVAIEATEKELRCYQNEAYCYYDGTCIPNGWICDWECDCGDCSDEYDICYKQGKLDEKYLNRKMAGKMKEKPMTTPLN